MTATETITSNPRVLGADPLVENGIGEEDIVSLVLPYIHNAREGVQRLGELLETYGTYEMNGIAFSDQNEIWWMETIGGHHRLHAVCRMMRMWLCQISLELIHLIWMMHLPCRKIICVLQICGSLLRTIT